jgi:hypothetical protein
MPLVSIIIPAYNQAQYLGRSIRSALGQTCADLEILVVDDGSTDETPTVARSFTDARVRYIRKANGGLSSARNAGIAQATGRFLSFLDSDDQFLPGKLEALLAAFEADPTLGLTAGQAILIDERGIPLGETFDRGLPEDPADLLVGNPLHVGSVLLRRDWQERAGFFDESLRSYEDWDLWLRLARAGCPMRSIPVPVSLYRFHRAQMTRIGTQMTTATFAVLDKTYAAPDLPPSWMARRDEAYSRARLRAAAQAYTGGDSAAARGHVEEAVRLDPSLAAGRGDRVARIAAGWANHVKTADPLLLLERVYDNLPDSLAALRSRRAEELSREAVHLAAGARRAGDASTARRMAWRAVRYRPAVLLDREVASLLWRAGAPRERHPSSEGRS